MWLKNVAEKALPIPVLWAVAEYLWAPVSEVVKWTSNNIHSVLDTVGNSGLNPLFAATWWVSASLLTNQVLKDFGMTDSKKTRYALSWVAWLAWLAWWPVVAPSLMALSLWYALWKPTWKYSKELAKRIGWTALAATWWGIKSAWIWFKEGWKNYIKEIKSWISWKYFWWEAA